MPRPQEPAKTAEVRPRKRLRTARTAITALLAGDSMGFVLLAPVSQLSSAYRNYPRPANMPAGPLNTVVIQGIKGYKWGHHLINLLVTLLRGNKTAPVPIYPPPFILHLQSLPRHHNRHLDDRRRDLYQIISK